MTTTTTFENMTDEQINDSLTSTLALCQQMNGSAFEAAAPIRELAQALRREKMIRTARAATTVEVSGNLAYVGDAKDGFVVAEIGERKWWGVRVYSNYHGGEAAGLPGFLGGISRKCDPTTGKRIGFEAGFSFPETNEKVTVGTYKTRKAAFKALVEYHLNRRSA